MKEHDNHMNQMLLGHSAGLADDAVGWFSNKVEETTQAVQGGAKAALNKAKEFKDQQKGNVLELANQIGAGKIAEAALNKTDELLEEAGDAVNEGAEAVKGAVAEGAEAAAAAAQSLLPTKGHCDSVEDVLRPDEHAMDHSCSSNAAPNTVDTSIEPEPKPNFMRRLTNTLGFSSKKSPPIVTGDNSIVTGDDTKDVKVAASASNLNVSNDFTPEKDEIEQVDLTDSSVLVSFSDAALEQELEDALNQADQVLDEAQEKFIT